MRSPAASPWPRPSLLPCPAVLAPLCSIAAPEMRCNLSLRRCCPAPSRRCCCRAAATAGSLLLLRRHSRARPASPIRHTYCLSAEPAPTLPLHPVAPSISGRTPTSCSRQAPPLRCSPPRASSGAPPLTDLAAPPDGIPHRRWPRPAPGRAMPRPHPLSTGAHSPARARYACPARPLGHCPVGPPPSFL